MATARPTFGAFNQGVIPTIACFKDKTAKTPLGVDLNALIAAMQAYVNQTYQIHRVCKRRMGSSLS